MLQANLAGREDLANPDVPDHRDTPLRSAQSLLPHHAGLAHPDLLDHRDPTEHLEPLAAPEVPETQEAKDNRAHRDPKDLPDLKDSLDLKDPWEMPDAQRSQFPTLLETLVHRVPLVLRVYLETLAQLEPLEAPETLDLKDHLDLKDQQDQKVNLAALDPKDHLDATPQELNANPVLHHPHNSARPTPLDLSSFVVVLAALLFFQGKVAVQKFCLSSYNRFSFSAGPLVFFLD